MKMMLALAATSRGWVAAFAPASTSATRPVPHGDVVACVHQAPRHWKSHHSEPEIAELFGSLSARFANFSHRISPCFAAIKAARDAGFTTHRHLAGQ
jgi:hypothetical protein